MSDLIYPISVNPVTGALTYGGSLGSANITDNSITSADVADGTLTSSDIASIDGGTP